jgi:hypothetical protein
LAVSLAKQKSQAKTTTQEFTRRSSGRRKLFKKNVEKVMFDKEQKKSGLRPGQGEALLQQPPWKFKN